MEYSININDSNYIVTASGENQELTAQIIKAMEVFYNIEEEYNQKKFEYDNAKLMMEKLFGKGFEEYGLKAIKSQYVNATYVPEGKPSIRKKLNEKALNELFEELGVMKDDYYTEEEIKGRKAYVKWGNK